MGTENPTKGKLARTADALERRQRPKMTTGRLVCVNYAASESIYARRLLQILEFL
jgi:hypothetical protein